MCVCECGLVRNRNYLFLKRVCTLLHDFRNGFEIEDSIVAEHEDILETGHDIAHRFAAQFKSAGDDVDFFLLQVMVLVRHLSSKVINDHLTSIRTRINRAAIGASDTSQSLS